MTIYSQYKDWEKPGGILYAWFSAMHTRTDILLYGRKKIELMSIVNDIWKIIIELEKKASFFDPASELFYINFHASESPVVVSEELFTIIKDCLDYNQKTFGCFDIAIKSDNYDRSTLSAVEVSDVDKTIYFHKEGIRLDLSGYLKGYALEKVHSLLEQYQQENALINCGNSSVLAIGNHPYGIGWKISDTNPLEKHEEFFCLNNQCLTTSGNKTYYQKHILNPFKGNYETGLRSVSVITDRATDGEVLSTALFFADDTMKKQLANQFSFYYKHSTPFK